MINDSGVLCSGSHGNKAEIGTLIRNAALRGKGGAWLEACWVSHNDRIRK